MADVKDLRAEIVTAIAGMNPAPGRMFSDLRVDLPADQFVPDTIRYQLRATPVGAPDPNRANVPQRAASVRISVYSMLADTNDERVYTEGALDTYAEAFGWPTWWNDLASVAAFQGVEYTEDRTEESNVVQATWVSIVTLSTG